ncbi:MAG TPA: DUF6152 family protein [Steroidobacteraceae bacterium]|nr:DUF6152 family protein [Steroidobacteraceae bacterium]
MKVRRRLYVALSGLALSVIASTMSLPTVAHHSEANRYMQGQPVVWQGTVERVSWDGAHVMYLVSVADKDGSQRNWQVLGGSPQRLSKRGIYQHSVKKGEAVTVAGYLNAGSKIVTPIYIAPADGHKMFVGYVDSDFSFRPQAAIKQPL